MYRARRTAKKSRGLLSALVLIHVISSFFTRMTPFQFTVSKQPLGCLRSDFFHREVVCFLTTVFEKVHITAQVN